MTDIDDAKASLQADLDSLKGVVTNISGDVDSLQSQVTALKQQIDAGGTVTLSDLKGFDDTVKSIKDSLSAVDAKEPPVSGGSGSEP